MSEQKVAFDVEDRGFRAVAYWPEDNKDAMVKITKDGKPHRTFTIPAYKVFNIAAHFSDIVDDEVRGMAIATSDGLGGSVAIKEATRPEPEEARDQ